MSYTTGLTPAVAHICWVGIHTQQEPWKNDTRRVYTAVAIAAELQISYPIASLSDI